MSESLKSQSLSSIKWSAIERFGVQGIQFIIGLILARLLSPFRLWYYWNTGHLHGYITNHNRSFNIVVGIVCYFILFVSSPFIATFFNEPILKDVLRVLA